MPTPLECLRLKARAGTITQASLTDALNIAAQIMQRNQPDEVAAAQKLVKVLQDRFTIKRIQVARQIMAVNEMQKRAAQADSRGVGAALMTLLTRDPRGRIGGANVESRYEEVRDLAHGIFVAGLERFRTTLFGIRQDRAGIENMLKELFGTDSKDPGAKAIAKVWQETDRFLAGRHRKAGGDLQVLSTWRVPQSHDWQRIARVPPAEWKADVFASVDRNAMRSHETGLPLTDAELDSILDDAYETQTMRGLNKTEGGSGFGSSLANRHRFERVIHFANFEKWKAYHDKYSDGDIYTAMMSHIDKRAREIALIEILGPNPDATIRQMKQLVDKGQQQELVDAYGAGDVWAQRWLRWTPRINSQAIQNVYDELTGISEIPVDEVTATSFRVTRNLLTSAQLGGAFVSAFTDWNFIGMAAAYNGISQTKVLGRAMRQFGLSGISTDDTAFAIRLGLGAQEWAGSAMAVMRAQGEMVGPGASRMVADFVMRASLLSSWTQAGRHAFGLEMAQFLAEHSGKSFADIGRTRGGRKLVAQLKHYQISESEWAAIGQNAMEQWQGARYISVKKLAQTDQALASKVMQFINEEMQQAIPTSNARVRAMLKQGSRAGSVWGEVARSVALYKSFPITILHNIVWRAIYGRHQGPLDQVMYIAQLGVMTTLLGALAMQAKQALAGKDPVDPFGDKAAEFWAAAALQGGALGIFGDFLFSDVTRFGKGPVTTFAGPVAGLVDDAFKLTAGNVHDIMAGRESNFGLELVNFMERYTPGSNIWFARIAVERAMFDRLALIADESGARRQFKQQQRRLRDDFGTDFWIAPGTLEPRTPRAEFNLDEFLRGN